MGLHARARRIQNSLRQEIVVGAHHILMTDEPKSVGGTDEGPTPHELLPAALAGCIGTMISMYARTKRWDVGEVVVDVDYDHKAQPRRFEVEVRLPGFLTPEQVARLRRVAATCPLRRSLEAGFEFEERFVLEAAPGRIRAA